MTPVLWTAWGRDWERSATPPRIVSTVVRTLRPGGTILRHDTDLHARGCWNRALDATATQPRARGQDAPRAVQS